MVVFFVLIYLGFSCFCGIGFSDYNRGLRHLCFLLMILAYHFINQNIPIYYLFALLFYLNKAHLLSGEVLFRLKSYNVLSKVCRFIIVKSAFIPSSDSPSHILKKLTLALLG